MVLSRGGIRRRTQVMIEAAEDVVDSPEERRSRLVACGAPRVAAEWRGGARGGWLAAWVFTIVHGLVFGWLCTVRVCGVYAAMDGGEAGTWVARHSEIT